ncbi:MAG: hypothetical protein PHH64_01845 [Proteiniphilum sp.]|nr:hypothetical protein [Proteiniphilum sp.]MDD4158144.1 hypothetical protein [Proteiniphilum sp.]MDD4800324.1 hypothetical protein [Proteiniphilum sp.]
MSLFRWLQRIRHSRGYGIHSPFAFYLIRYVLRSKLRFYAFDDIEADLLKNCPGRNPVKEFHHLCFRLVHYLKPKNILEIYSGRGVNTLFLLSPASDIRCTCVEERAEEVAVAGHLTAGRSSHCTFLPALPRQGKYDAIFIHMRKGGSLSVDSLLRLSHEGTFWVIHPLKVSRSKQFWRSIVKDERARITFDRKDTGIVFLRHTYSKLHYEI